uniref:Uncharacterized protein n=1 Tax=Anopheles culicifacies TaxID=139723 RepID=A0A182MMC3_9DIPT
MFRCEQSVMECFTIGGPISTAIVLGCGVLYALYRKPSRHVLSQIEGQTKPCNDRARLISSPAVGLNGVRYNGRTPVKPYRISQLTGTVIGLVPWPGDGRYA